MPRFRVHLLRYLALPSGNDTVRAQSVSIRAHDEDEACEIARERYGHKPPPWRSGVQINRVEPITESERAGV